MTDERPTGRRRNQLVARLRTTADRLEAEARTARHRLEIENKGLTTLLKAVDDMRLAAQLLEDLSD